MPGGSFENGTVSPWSLDYASRAVDTTGLVAEGGSAGPFACDSDGFACFVYNAGTYTQMLTEKQIDGFMRGSI